MSFDALDFKIVKIHRLPEGNRIKAFVDLGINDAILIKGVRIVDSRQRGLFVAMPQEKGKDEKWYEKVRCLNDEVRLRINKEVLEAYEAQSK